MLDYVGVDAQLERLLGVLRAGGRGGYVRFVPIAS
jgi:hypothetical protein